MEVVGEAEAADVVVRLVRSLRPDLVLVDVRMPGGGLAAARQIKQDAPDVSVLILSQYDDPTYLHQAMAAGASGYALKRAAGQELLQGIRTVARGDVYLDPAIARVLVEESWGPRQAAPAPAPAQALSERETQVLRLVALGYTTQEVAEQLALSIRTVETYKLRCTEKLRLSGRAALVRYALQHGLLEADLAS
jgi:DNA-binding NarL/FixJ family response regulator